jgi:truncated hemoglobin YjbI
MTEPPSPYDLLGGRAPVLRLAARFYEVMEANEPALAAVHRQAPAGGVDPEVKERFALFLVGWLGGPQEYMERHGHPRLRMRHARVPVDQKLPRRLDPLHEPARWTTARSPVPCAASSSSASPRWPTSSATCRRLTLARRGFQPPTPTALSRSRRLAKDRRA